MDFDLYLSEMSVSDHHGGGLTLQRILGEDLNAIPWFVHVTRFGAELPATSKFVNKSVDLWSVWESDLARKLLGRTLSSKISKSLFAIKLHAQSAAKALDQKFINKAPLNILVSPQSANAIFTLEALKKKRKVNYITWIMDDHLVKFTGDGWTYPSAVEAAFAAHLRGANHVFVISPAMQEFYRDRFNIGSTVLFGSADMVNDHWQYKINTQKPVKIGYFGAVAAWQTDALQLVANALHHTPDSLHIYSGVDKLPDDMQGKQVYLEGRIHPSDVLKTMRAYDALLLPISFLPEMRNMSEFNIATKMSEYLASGVPILVVGPDHSAMVKYLKANNAALIVGLADVEEIKETIKLVRNESRVGEILNNAKKMAVNETGSIAMRKKWLKFAMEE